jgi:PAS domain S-box-containing protein
MTIEVPPSAASSHELLEALPVAAVLLAPAEGDLRVEYANPAARREAGIPLDGATVGGRLPALRDAGMAVLAGGAPYEVDAVEVGDRIFELRAVRHADRLLTTFSDITARARAAQQLERREAQLAQAQEMAHLGSWEWDLRTNRVEWSEELHRIYGVRPGEFGGTLEAFLERVHPEMRERIGATIQAAIAEGVPFAFEERVLRPDGSERVLSSRGMVVERDAAGAPVRVAGACLDITDARQTAAQLADSKRAAVRDLSTPILQVRSGLLILPVVGALDGERAARLAQQLLERIRATRARAVVVDLTGVPAFEPSVASPLVHAVESARLMGARTIVTGLSADIAAALVDQDLDLSAITVAGDLQAGIEDAERLLDQRAA